MTTPAPTADYCSYHDAGHILFEKAGISPRMRGHELEMWAQLDYDNLQLYLDKNLNQKATPRDCKAIGITVESCYFSMQQVESFNPDAPENSGRWLTFQELARRWYHLAQHSSLESVHNLILSVHNRTVKNERIVLYPLSNDDEFFAIDPYSDVADRPEQGMYQLRQIEKFEKHYFKTSVTQLPAPEAIGYDIALQILKERHHCSAEEFTIWCRWDNAYLKPYEDRELKRPFSLRSAQITSLADCLLGTFFSKSQVESFCPDERYIPYRGLLRRIMDASGYDEARAEQLVANKFDHDRGKEEAPNEICDSNTLGMNWTSSFQGKSTLNAAYELNKVEKFISSYFPKQPPALTTQRTESAFTITPNSAQKKQKRTRITSWHSVMDEFIAKEGKVPQIHEMMNHFYTLSNEGHPIIEEVTDDRLLMYVKNYASPIKRRTVETRLSTIRTKNSQIISRKNSQSDN